MYDAGLVERIVAFVRHAHVFDARGGVVVASDRPERSGLYASARTFHAFKNCNAWLGTGDERRHALPVRKQR